MKKLIKGNEAIAEAAVRAGCRFFAGYPITPQNEIPEYLCWRLPEVGGAYVQGESEVASSYMIYGAATTGVRCMSSSSGCGIALYTEGLGFITGSDLPTVIVNISRGGPGLGEILPAQQDYFSATKAPSNGGSRCFVLAPVNVQEAVDMVYEAFDIADKYRCICYVLADGVIGNMMEGVVFPEMRDLADLPNKDDWRINKRSADDKKRVITSWYGDVNVLESLNIKHMRMYEEWKKTEVRVEEYLIDDAEIVFAAYGTSARVAKSVIKTLRAEGIKAGLIRPKTLFPFPEENFTKLDKNKVKKVICLEMSYPGQLVEDIRAYVDKAIPVEHYGRSGGAILKPEDALRAIRKML